MNLTKLYTRTALSRLVNVDARTLRARIEKLQLPAAAVLGDGRVLFDEHALQTLRSTLSISNVS